MYISEHEPRKGTETSMANRTIGVWKHFRTRTPKGDGNSAGQESTDRFFQNFRTRTPKGDGNLFIHDFHQILYPISEHEPRKGTETMDSCLVAGEREEFQNTNPERGRKQARFRGNSRDLQISEHEPRKGTETDGAA